MSQLTCPKCPAVHSCLRRNTVQFDAGLPCARLPCALLRLPPVNTCFPPQRSPACAVRHTVTVCQHSHAQHTHCRGRALSRTQTPARLRPRYSYNKQYDDDDDDDDITSRGWNTSEGGGTFLKDSLSCAWWAAAYSVCIEAGAGGRRRRRRAGQIGAHKNER